MKNYGLFILLISLFLGSALTAQYTQQDSLRGSITMERAWWNLVHYNLQVEVNPKKKSISGTNTIQYQVLKPHYLMQIDLQSPLQITSVEQDGVSLEFESNGNAHFIKLHEPQKEGSLRELTVAYEGKPKEAARAPWDGGFSWKKDESGEHFIATSCQGLGASVWWPCKDHMYDEVDSMNISVEVPEHLSDISNGRLIKVDHNKKKNTKTFHWQVKNPINNYGVNVNIGNYVNWSEVYNGEKGNLDIDYWALVDDESKAKEQFKQVPMMLEAFEHWFGPYPFYEDGYKLVQVPYLGMEHQSSVTYGNKFKNGYLGRDLSGTGWGLKFDFIIIHESGHEWFANNVTHQDIADMWIHESFTNYSESLYLDYHFGKEAGQEYVRGTRSSIQNAKPMIGNYDVNDETYPGDVYYKGGNILNMLRTIVDDDEKWRGLLRSINKTFYHQTINTFQLERYIADYLELDLTAFFSQYLHHPDLPILEYYIEDGRYNYRWNADVDTFEMPLDIVVEEERIRISPKKEWSYQEISKGEVSVDPNYYIAFKKYR